MLPRIDTPPIQNIGLDPDLRRWFTTLTDTLNSVIGSVQDDFDNIIADESPDIGGGGAGALDVTVTGLTASSVVVASIVSSSNPVSIISVLPGVDKFSITFSADPGASCFVNYIAFIEPKSA